MVETYTVTGPTNPEHQVQWRPAYIDLLENGALAERAQKAYQLLQRCRLCPRYCGTDRRVTVKGAVCRTGVHAVVHSYGPHHGEENPLRGWNGSGTLFFSGCNLRCVYCQNWEISQKRVGREIDTGELAGMMLELQSEGCHNINLVSPSHVVAQVIAAVSIAARQGLHLPIVYNTGGYDSPEALALLDGIIDIYMPDMKYGNSIVAREYSRVRDYVEVSQQAVREMHRQVGDLVLDHWGLARRGLLVRHLVLPGDLAGTNEVLSFIAREISENTYLNLLDQYRPCYRADAHPPLDRSVSRKQYQRALKLAADFGLSRLDQRCQRGRWGL